LSLKQVKGCSVVLVVAKSDFHVLARGVVIVLEVFENGKQVTKELVGSGHPGDANENGWALPFIYQTHSDVSSLDLKATLMTDGEATVSLEALVFPSRDGSSCESTK
jgi:hypothetical protein